MLAKPAEVNLGNYRMELEELVLDVTIRILKQDVVSSRDPP